MLSFRTPGPQRRKGMAAVGAAGDRTRSELEDRFLAFLARHGGLAPQTGVWIEGYELDFVGPRAGLVVELDGIAAPRHAHHLQCRSIADRRLWRSGYARCG